MPNPLLFNRRQVLNRFGLGLGGFALAELLSQPTHAAPALDKGALGEPHFAPRAKRIIYLFQSGAPSQLDLFDPKPGLNRPPKQPRFWKSPKRPQNKPSAGHRPWPQGAPEA